MDSKKVVYSTWKIIYPLFLYEIIALVASFFFVWGYNTLDISALQSSSEGVERFLDFVQSERKMLESIFCSILQLPIFLVLYQMDKKGSRLTEQPAPAKLKVIDYVWIILFAIFLSLGFNDLLTASQINRLFPEYTNEVATVFFSGSVYVQIIKLVILAPIVEELLFRGILYGRIRMDFSPRVAMLLTSVLFGVFHGNIVQGIYAFIIGLALAWIREYYHTIAASVAAHMAANFIIVMAGVIPFLSYRTKTWIIFIPVMLIELVLAWVCLRKMKGGFKC